MARQADGTIYINTEIDGAGFKSGINSMQGGLGKLTKSVKRLGIAIGSVFAIKELVQFGKEAIELGSDLQEVQNVVEVTFTTLADEVDNFAKAAAKTAGLSETMAKRYAGTFGAMAKAFGFAEENAFDMATALTQLSGDIASFYNITQDEAYTKLKSIFTGETESLKDLGVVMTQTALDSFAMQKGIGKATSQMTEQEKVALRYSFVLEQLSLASGDFQRTSDGWANQMRILSLNIESFKANIGQGLINLFTPVVQVINILIEKLGVLAEKFKAFTELITGRNIEKTNKSTSTLANNFFMSAEGVDDFATSLKKANKEAKKTLSPLDNLNNLTSGISDNLGNAGFGNISMAKGDASLNVEGLDEIGKTSGIISIIISKFEEFKNKVLSVYNGYIKPVIDSLKADFMSIVEIVVNWWNGKMKPVFDRWGEKFTEIKEKHLGPLIDAFSILTNKIKELWQDVLMPFIQEVVSGFLEFMTPVIEEFGILILDAFGNAIDIASLLIEALANIIDFLIGVFTGDWERAWESLVSAFEKIVEAITKFFEGLFGWIFESLGIIAENIKGLFDDGKGGGVLVPQTPKVQVPHLATGAVLPPNAPFMAMLGDQRNGRNLEAPEGLIRQIMRDELAQLSLARDNRPLVVEISGKEIFRIVQDEADEYFETTGREAFP